MQAKNLRTLALIITICGWGVVALSLIAALSQAAWLVSYTQFAESPVMLAVSGITGAINNLVYLISVIPVLIWIYTAHDNLRKTGVTGLKRSPGWATFSFFVPIANLFVPFGAMRELANRSAGEPEELAEASVDEVTSWWGCWLGSLLLAAILLIVALIDSVPGLFVTTPFWAHQLLMIMQLVLTAGAAFFLVKVVKLITASQIDGASVLSTFE
ncbi:DUF4328 domain-containing protein [Erythrobacter sp. THAF29]|uniref:DUF4328 domain-containing protein n=1 Tax=Erythrobacter sp. THAF29 TaxID=2587851 RepID=UPI001268B8C0|nr:DUF4328 domain-containing protein [Erythrobacter sp. THAF29]QFT78395.1 hypothetical protein FIU90_12665 [Erythrobacter sp. THAF29]